MTGQSIEHLIANHWAEPLDTGDPAVTPKSGIRRGDLGAASERLDLCMVLYLVIILPASG